MTSVFARPFLWCCTGCIRGDDDSTEYYSLLGLSPSATQEDIKKAWRKISLQMHPDKLAQRGQTVGTKEQEEFSQTKDAYQILSDPSRRQVYDAYGANGVKWLENPSSINPQAIMKNFTKSSVQDRCRVVTLFFLIFFVILLFPILLCLKLDGHDIGWFIVFIPLFIFELIMILIQFIALKKLNKTIEEMNLKEMSNAKKGQSTVDDIETGACQDNTSTSTSSQSKGSATQSSDDDDVDSDDDDSMMGDAFDREYARDSTRVALITSCLSLLWQILLVLRLQWHESFGLSIGIMISPMLLSELYECYHNYHMGKRLTESAHNVIVPSPPSSTIEGDEEGEMRPEAKVKAMRLLLAASANKSVSHHALRAIFVLLLMFKLDEVNMNWWFVFTPLWILFAYDCFSDILELGGVGQSAEVDNPLAIVLHACCGVGVVFAMALLSFEKITGASFSAFWIFSPVFFLGGCLLCCITCVVCCTIDTESENINYSPLVDSRGRAAEAERPPTPERSRPVRPSYTNPQVDNKYTSAQSLKVATTKVEDSVIDMELFQSPPVTLPNEKSAILNDID